MKNKILKKGLAVGIICLLMLVIIPNVIGYNNKEKTTQNIGVNDIEFPKEEGPYTVFISGQCNGGGIPDPIGFDILGLIRYGYPRWFNLGAFFYSQWPYGPEYRMEEGSVFIVNGEVQDIEYPVQIALAGVKGFMPAVGQLIFKSMIEGKIRIFGVCEEIRLWHGPN